MLLHSKNFLFVPWGIEPATRGTAVDRSATARVVKITLFNYITVTLKWPNPFCDKTLKIPNIFFKIPNKNKI